MDPLTTPPPAAPPPPASPVIVARAWELPGDVFALTVFAAAGLELASRVFRKQLD